MKSLYWSENQNHLYDSIAYDLITNPEAVYSFVDRVQRQCALENNPAGIATSLVQKAYIYRVTTLNNIDSTIKLLYGAKKLALQLEDPVIISTVYAD
ncbi:MAG: hypothetical protein MRY83_03385, partial [Flavobacteriales bacterium]|nr:hypothetical protein [Flavobacteriales bacterium]